MDITIRLEEASDHRAVEELTREAFWNHYAPGCDEHYLAHILRDCPDFIPELDFVAEVEGRLGGSIMYSRSRVVDAAGNSHPTITFGPLSVLPELQGQGVGGALIRHSKAVAKALGYGAILIYGDPDYYSRFGFSACGKLGITGPDGKCLAAHMACELQPGALQGVSGTAHESPVYQVDAREAAAFDQSFPPKEKITGTPSQQRFAQLLQMYVAL